MVSRSVGAITEGILITIAIALISFGASALPEGGPEWYIGAVALIIGIVLLIVDRYIMHGETY